MGVCGMKEEREEEMKMEKKWKVEAEEGKRTVGGRKEGRKEEREGGFTLN